MLMSEEELLRAELTRLREEHAELDAELVALAEDRLADRLEIQRLKKRKLLLKDRIARIEDQLYPDIPA